MVKNYLFRPFAINFNKRRDRLKESRVARQATPWGYHSQSIRCRARPPGRALCRSGRLLREPACHTNSRLESLGGRPLISPRPIILRIRLLQGSPTLLLPMNAVLEKHLKVPPNQIRQDVADGINQGSDKNLEKHVGDGRGRSATCKGEGWCRALASMRLSRIRQDCRMSELR